jgi:hypothetical protein
MFPSDDVTYVYDESTEINDGPPRVVMCINQINLGLKDQHKCITAAETTLGSVTSKYMNDCHLTGGGDLIYHYATPNVSVLLAAQPLLHTIIVISNPCEYKRRWHLAEQFIRQMQQYQNLVLYVVELAYDNQTFHVTETNNKHHLQLRTQTPLWHKETMINAGVRHLLPPDWKYMAWIDADIVFDNSHWVLDTLHLFHSGRFDIVQLFSHCLDLDANGQVMTIFQGAAFQHVRQLKNQCKNIINYYHPGFAWAMTREAYEQMGGLFDLAILGSADDHMCKAWLQNNRSSAPPAMHANYHKQLKAFSYRCKGLRVGYVPGVINHMYHGKKKNRKYQERWQVLIEHQFDPDAHLTRDEVGLVMPREQWFPAQLKADIMQYFNERNEDD